MEDVLGTEVEETVEDVQDTEDEFLGLETDYSEYEDEDEDEDEDDKEEESETEESEQQEEVTETEQKKKRVQTPEENARFAEMRRQQQFQERLQQTAEYRLAKMLADQYGLTPEQMLQQLEEQRMEQEAKERNIPVELIKEREALRKEQEQMRQQLLQIQFQGWKARIDAEAQTVKQNYPMLSDEEIDIAKQAILTQFRNVDMPLETAVLAVHGQKIIESLREMTRQEALAEITGRSKKSPLPIKGSKPPQTETLTEEEKYVARQMGMTEEEYLKYKY